MENWVECVPNFSEGRDTAVIEELARSIEAVSGVYLLDREQDASHNRSVFSIVGPPDAVRQAAFAAAKTACRRIDLTKHRGEHPRIGATDVIPFIPLGKTSMEACVGLARDLGRQIWQELSVPVYLYEEAASSPDRRDLAVLRKGEFEGLREEVMINPARRPDFGEAMLHPTAGATVVGARWFLVAFNAYLNTNDLRIAKEIAKAIRFSSGGFRYVKALGFSIEERDQVQISMNLVNYRGTAIHRAVEFIRREAQRYGVAVVSTEIVGLVPQEALNMAADYHLQLERFSEEQILEHKIEKALRESRKQIWTLDSFLDDLSSSNPTPGGGSVGALAGALAASLGVMVSDITLSKEKFKEAHPAVRPHAGILLDLRKELLQLIREDAQAYEQVVAAYKLPKGSDAEKFARKSAIDNALRLASDVPLRTAKLSVRCLESLHAIRTLINPNALSDLGVGAQMALAAGKSGLYNVRVNLVSLPDDAYRQSRTAEAAQLWSRLEELAAGIQEYVLVQLG